LIGQVQDIQINERFRSLIPPLSQEEHRQLEENILEHGGARDPLVVWPVGDVSVLVDGHNRYEICTRLGLPFSISEQAFSDEDAASDWIDRNQLGRRNLTPDQASYLRGRRYNRVKKADGQRGPEKLGNSCQAFASTAERLAVEHGVSPRTIRNDAKFAEAVDAVKAIEPEIEHRVAAGTAPARSVVIEAAALMETAPELAAEVLTKKAHVANNSGNNEWYTPPALIEAARQTMGAIDCDPASSPVANATVGASTFYTADDDGLRQAEWGARVWMNPPYAQPLISQFCEELARRVREGEVTDACVLVNNATDTAWFHTLLSVASAVCFLRGRVRFLDPAGAPSGAPLQGQAVVYIGDGASGFADAFAGNGKVLVTTC
jgi:hypothetical protein